MKRVLYTCLSVLSFSYYLWLGMHNGFGMSVLPFWLLLSLLFLLLGYHARLPVVRKLPPPVLRIFKAVLLVGLIFFLMTEVLILWGMTRSGSGKPDYIIVLGAALNGDKPSSVLEQRLERACLYLESRPETKVIVSGGQGPSETISEAESMKNWLTEKGISEARIFVEDKSTTTAENMRYSFPYINADNPDTDINVGIVTNNFHVFRSVCIANRIKKEPPFQKTTYNIYGIAADFPPLLLPHYMVREFFTICVDALLGNMSFN